MARRHGLMLGLDLNSDIGEGYGQFKVGNDADIIPWITSANVAVGMHAGDPMIMSKTLSLCKHHNVSVGAHPGYMDLHGFGRRSVKMSLEDFEALVCYQLGAFKTLCDFKGLKFHHVKPHGAMYNDLAVDGVLAKAFAEIIRRFDPSLLIYGLSNTALEMAVEKCDLKFVPEIFVDRNYTSDGLLVSRGIENAIIEEVDEMVERIIEWTKTGKIKAITGEIIEIKGKTLCIHGDQPNGALIARKLNDALSYIQAKID